jgi:hypothetical protein
MRSIRDPGPGTAITGTAAALAAASPPTPAKRGAPTSSDRDAFRVGTASHQPHPAGRHLRRTRRCRDRGDGRLCRRTSRAQLSLAESRCAVSRTPNRRLPSSSGR